MYRQPRFFFINLGLTILFAIFSWGSANAASVFFNEIHYDNSGVDIGEAIEIAGPAGTDLTGWSILLYNGATGSLYNTTLLTGVIPIQQNGFGTLQFSYPTNGLQNGAPDGLALLDSTMNLVQFLSYEGSFTAIGGAANGLTSTNFGVAESGSTQVGHSLQLTGIGNDSSDFIWSAAMANTFGGVNTGQSFTRGSQQPVPEPSTLLFLSSGLIGLSIWRWKQKS